MALFCISVEPRRRSARLWLSFSRTVGDIIVLLCPQHVCIIQGCAGFDYFKSGRSQTWPDLGTQIHPDLDLGKTRDERTICQVKLLAWITLTAAIKRQYSSVFPSLRLCLPVFTKFVERQCILCVFCPSITIWNCNCTTWQVCCVSFICN